MSQELNEISVEIDENENRVKEGIPLRAYELECPDDELRISVLQEFHILDFNYKEKLRQLNENNHEIIHQESTGRLGGWSRAEHELFQHIYEQYHFHNINLNNCNFSLRDLMFDKIKKLFANLFPGKKYDRIDFVRHEEWSNASKYYQQQKRLIVAEWHESRRALLEKAEAIFAEAFEIIAREKHKKEEKRNQLRICNQLYEKVSRWRMQKLEALEIQQNIDRMIKQQNAEKLRFENEKKMKKRMEEKRAVSKNKNSMSLGSFYLRFVSVPYQL